MIEINTLKHKALLSLKQHFYNFERVIQKSLRARLSSPAIIILACLYTKENYNKF
jgi:hypothetical protein